MKKCSRCKKEKPLELFYTARRLSDGLTTQCKSCMTNHREANKERNRLYMKKRRELDNEFIKATRRKSYAKKRQQSMLTQAKNRARRKGIEFDLDLEDIVIPELCPLLNVPFMSGTKGNYSYTPSLDRKDNSKGYVKGNVQVITMKANSMKNDATPEELLTFAKNIIKQFT